MTRRLPIQPQGRRPADCKALRELKAAHADPADLAERVAEYQRWISDKRSGKLPMYERVWR